jgi:hypothetical protein
MPNLGPTGSQSFRSSAALLPIGLPGPRWSIPPALLAGGLVVAMGAPACGSRSTSNLGAVGQGGSAGASQDGSSPTDSSEVGQGGDANGSFEFVGGPDGGSTCAHLNVDITRIVPDVWLMVDGSGSMGAPLQGAGPSRYETLRDALIDPMAGVVWQLQGSIAFGLYEYDGCAYSPLIPGAGCLVGACPRVISVNPGLDNFNPIAMTYPPNPPGASTPTDVALAALGQRINGGVSTSNPRPPTYVILGTDGEPNLCDWHDGLPSDPQFQQNALMAVQSMAASGTKVFVVSLAGDPDTQAYLDQVAAAGGTGSPAFTPTSSGALVTALQTILGGTVSCDVKLTGKVVAGMECSGSVVLNGTSLACNAPNGWSLVDSQTIELAGTACEALRTDPTSTLSASFPCNAYSPPK